MLHYLKECFYSRRRKEIDVISYGNGLALIIQKEPFRLLSIKENGQNVTRKYATYPEFKDHKEAFFIEHGETNETIMYYNFSDEQLELLQHRLALLNNVSKKVPSLFDVIDEIEDHFEQLSKFAYEWHTYSKDNQESLKGNWHARLLREVDITDKQQVSEHLPLIIKESWLRYSGLKQLWASLPLWKEQNLLFTWGDIIVRAYERKEKELTTSDITVENKTFNTEFETRSYASGIQLIVQTSPTKLLALKRNDAFVIHKFLPPFQAGQETSYFLENRHNGNPILLADFSEEQVENIKEHLKQIDESSPHILTALELVEAIEKDFTDRRGLRQEWESAFSRQQQDQVKQSLAIKIAEEVDFCEVERAIKIIPQIVKDGLCTYSNMAHQWEQMDGDIEEEILSTWGCIIQDILKK